MFYRQLICHLCLILMHAQSILSTETVVPAKNLMTLAQYGYSYDKFY